ncbi:hypothetical protein F5887DRAFT_920209 [Amanita rubescens]|nr:hypothetical protein F5887DRAFT_920209 [Amanita rubescens]
MPDPFMVTEALRSTTRAYPSNLNVEAHKSVFWTLKYVHRKLGLLQLRRGAPPCRVNAGASSAPIAALMAYDNVYYTLNHPLFDSFVVDFPPPSQAQRLWLLQTTSNLHKGLQQGYPVVQEIIKQIQQQREPVQLPPAKKPDLKGKGKAKEPLYVLVRPAGQKEHKWVFPEGREHQSNVYLLELPLEHEVQNVIGIYAFSTIIHPHQQQSEKTTLRRPALGKRSKRNKMPKPKVTRVRRSPRSLSAEEDSGPADHHSEGAEQQFGPVARPDSVWVGNNTIRTHQASAEQNRLLPHPASWTPRNAMHPRKLVVSLFRVLPAQKLPAFSILVENNGVEDTSASNRINQCWVSLAAPPESSFKWFMPTEGYYALLSQLDPISAGRAENVQ